MSAVRAADQPGTGAEPPEPDDRLIGGEVEAGTGRLPPFFRWLNISLYLAAIVYLLTFVVIDRVESYLILLVLAVLLAAWTVYFASQKKPPEP